MEQEIKKCPYCGEEILVLAQKCKHCGEWLNNEKEEEGQMVPCPICGELIKEGIDVCPYCNENLDQEDEIVFNENEEFTIEDYESKVELENIEDKKKTWLIVVLTSVLLIFLIGGIYFLFCNSDNGNSSQQEEIYISNDRVETPYKLNVINVEYWDNLNDQGNNTYVPANMLDGNPSTAWAVDLDKASYDCDKLYGPTFTLKCKKLSHIIIRNGYAKSKDSFKNNARASRIIFCNSANVSDEDEQSSYLYEGILKDTPDEQTLKISQDIPCNNNLTTVQMIFPVDGLRRGVKWNDLCVSEIEFYGYE